MTQSILVVDDSETMLKLVSEALKGNGYDILLAPDGKTALDIISRTELDMALLDVMLPDMDGYDICKLLRNTPKTAHIPILMLTGYGDLENRLQAFEAGADDFMPKPFEMAELQARVRAQLRRTSRQATLPAPEAATPFLEKIAVFSLRGGLGVSTLAVNLAAGLQQLWGQRTLLADMAFVNGQAALMLDVPLKNTWADLGRIATEEIDKTTLERVVLHHPCGLDVLAAPKQVENAELISQELVERVLELAPAQYKYMVMDLPHDFSVTTVTALDAADKILYLVSPDLASVHCASNALRVFKDLGYADEKVQVVLNWNFSTTGLARKEIEKAIQKPVSVVIPFIQDTLVMALTMGKPVVLEPGKAEAALFEDLAYFWSREEHKKNEPANPSLCLQRVLDRAKRRQMQKQKSG